MTLKYQDLNIKEISDLVEKTNPENLEVFMEIVNNPVKLITLDGFMQTIYLQADDVGKAYATSLCELLRYLYLTPRENGIPVSEILVDSASTFRECRSLYGKLSPEEKMDEKLSRPISHTAFSLMQFM